MGQLYSIMRSVGSILLAAMGGDLNGSMQHFTFRELKMECRYGIQNPNKIHGCPKGGDMGSLTTWRVDEFNRAVI